nr:MAG: hypothetical protein DIU78_10355 [Pseudomonadota bacterium]
MLGFRGAVERSAPWFRHAVHPEEWAGLTSAAVTALDLISDALPGEADCGSAFAPVVLVMALHSLRAERAFVFPNPRRPDPPFRRLSDGGLPGFRPAAVAPCRRVTGPIQARRSGLPRREVE